MWTTLYAMLLALLHVDLAHSEQPVHLCELPHPWTHGTVWEVAQGGVGDHSPGPKIGPDVGHASGQRPFWGGLGVCFLCFVMPCDTAMCLGVYALTQASR